MQPVRGRGRFRVALVSAVFLVLPVATPLHAQGAQDIAGLSPSVRPKSAPVITDYPKNDAWYAAALKGVEQPYPQSLRFLESQGAWFTPFIHPGMTGPYDIRGWHSAATASPQ